MSLFTVRIDAFRLRLALMAAGLLCLGLFTAWGGRLGLSSQATVLIEFGAYPDDFVGSSVEIDGKVAGTLRMFGGTRTAFSVPKGSHQVRILHARFPSETRTVEVRNTGTVLLILNFRSGVDGSGVQQTVIGFE